MSSEEAPMAKDEFPPEASAGSASIPDLPEASESSPSESSSSSSSSGSSSGSDSGSDSLSSGDSPDQLQSAYEQLSPEEQLMHLQALKAAIMKHSGGDPAQSAPAPQGPPMGAPAGADAGVPAEGSPPVAPAYKSEAKDKEIAELRKRAADAEAKVKQLSPEVEDLQKSVGILTDAFEKMLSKPQQKAFTARNFVPEVSAPAVDLKKLTKSEITEKLKEVSKRPDLKKHDRELINGFYNGKNQIADLGHFFK